MKVRIQKLHPDAITPKYASRGSSGFDLHALENSSVAPGETKLIRTGVTFEIPEGFELQVRPRSGLSLKTPLRLSNSPGTVDADYRGEVQILAWNTAAQGGPAFEIKKGDKIAQGVICPVLQVQFEEVRTLSETERGAGGFGSTGVSV